MTVQDSRLSHVRTGTVIAGATVVALGVAMLLDTTELVDINSGRLIGPFVLIAMGTAVLFGGGRCRGDEDDAGREKFRRAGRQRSAGGIWLIGLGCWLLISQTGLFGLTFGTSWPLLLILVGALMVIRGGR
jgi:hypothetical protein